jgi:hypothetical protein
MKTAPVIGEDKVSCGKGDAKIGNVTQIRKYYNGRKWRRLCSVDKCDKTVQIGGFCARHLRNRPVGELSFDYEPQSNFTLVEETETSEKPEQHVIRSPGKIFQTTKNAFHLSYNLLKTLQ